MTQPRGMSLLEISLAVSVGLMLTVGGVYAYRQHLKATQITQAKLMLETLRQGVETSRYRQGRYPTLAELDNNLDAGGRKIYELGNRPRRDPLYPPADPNADSPIKAYGPPSPPWGGWLYQATPQMRLVPNLPDSNFPGDEPSRW